MADPEMDEDLFADLYDGEDVDPTPAAKTEPPPVQAEPQNDHADQAPAAQEEPAHDDVNIKTDAGPSLDQQGYGDMQGMQGMEQQNGGFSGGFSGGFGGGFGGGHDAHGGESERPVSIKEDGKMFIGGLNWETTDQSLKDYFSQFGEVVECTVMRDGATGRSRGFGFLTFKDPKNVNTVMVKEHSLDGKLIDPKRAIPRDEQEKTAKIFVGGVSQEATDHDFRSFFEQFGNVLDATLMMDKDTGRPRGFGFVTFDGDDAVDRTLAGPLQICNKPIEVKRAQPRGNMRDEEGGRGGKFNRHGKQDNFGGGGGNFNQQNQSQMPQDGQNGQNNMSPAMMGAYWQRMQQYFQMMQQQMAANMGGGGMNPMAAMQNNPAMMQQMMARQGMNPAMMQQMGAMQGYPGMPQTGSPMQNNGAGSPMQQNRAGLNPQEQLMFEQRKYEQQAMQRMQGGGGSFDGQNTWEGMYDDVPAPAGMQGGGNMRGGFAGGRGRGARFGSQGPSPQPAAQAPANAPTGPKNAGRPGANYRGGGRGGHRGFHPYARGGG